MNRDEKGRFVSEGRVYARGYKGFNPGLRCRDKQYKENTVFAEDVASMCAKGMHFCKKAKDVLYYYSFLRPCCALNEFAEVKALDKVVTLGNKSVTTKLKILGKLSITEFISHIAAYFSDRLKTLKWSSSPVQISTKFRATLCTSRIDARMAGTGNGMELLAKESARLVSVGDDCSLYAEGFGRLASAGYRTQMVSMGNNSVLSTSGYGCHLITTGDDTNMATAGEMCNLTATGDRALLASAGGSAALVALGKASMLASVGMCSRLYAEGRLSRMVSAGAHDMLYAAGERSVAVAIGPCGKVKGKLGCFLGCAEWNSYTKLKSFASGWVDGKNIKPDTWYTAKDGQLVEVEE